MEPLRIMVNVPPFKLSKFLHIMRAACLWCIKKAALVSLSQSRFLSLQTADYAILSKFCPKPGSLTFSLLSAATVVVVVVPPAI